MTTNSDKIQVEKLWRNLGQCQEEVLYCGVLFKFKTADTYGHNSVHDYQYALGVKLDGSTELCFVDIDGESWGYGRCLLPPESRFEDKKYTLSSKWILDNFHYICEVADKNDICYCKKFDPIPTR